jgi:glycosyltransferase involved in cell wall biosynthesis
MSKKNVVISAINLFEGGPLSVLKDFLFFLNDSKDLNHYKFIALVHKKSMFNEQEYDNIAFVEFPKSRISYAYRLYYEYVYFKSVAAEHSVFFWLSLHDMTPSIGNVSQAVYCHNPSPFNSVNFSDIYMQPTQFFFRLFYKYLYQINIKKNKFVIVQQLWMKDKFKEMFDLNKDKIIIAPPEIQKIESKYVGKSIKKLENKEVSKKVFFFPTFPRPFKNIEVICEAMSLVSEETEQSVSMIITIDGSENKYSKIIVEKYKHIKSINFIGLIKREKVYEYYAQSDCLIFPSKLETWGLPISEFKQFNKPMLLADLPYAKETVGNYEFVSFFNPDDPVQLSELIINVIENKLVFDKTVAIDYEQPYVIGWDELFTTLLK